MMPITVMPPKGSTSVKVMQYTDDVVITATSAVDTLQYLQKLRGIMD